MKVNLSEDGVWLPLWHGDEQNKTNEKLKTKQQQQQQQQQTVSHTDFALSLRTRSVSVRSQTPES